MHQYYTNDNSATNSHMEQHHPSSFLGQDHSTSSSFLTSTYNDISQNDQFHESESESQRQQQQQQMSNDMDLSKQHDFGSQDFLTAPSGVEILSEPPPYDQFTVDWPGGLPSIPFQTPSDFSQPPKIFQPEEEEFFGQFLGTIEKDNFLFNPDLPEGLLMMPQYIPPTNDSTYGETVTFSPLDNVYGLPSDIAADASNSTSLSPRTQNLALSSSPKADNAKLPSPSSDNNSNSKNNSNNNNNRKRGRIDDDDPKNTRRSSNPRLTPANTKVASTSSRNVTSTSSRPSSPTLELSSLSIDIDGNGNDNNSSSTSSSSGGDGDGDGNSRNNNSGTASPTPQSPNRESTKTESVLMDNEDDEDDDDVEESSSNINTNEGSVDIKSESKTTEGSSKSSRKPYKELLTEEEKRANHIASEQKRRNTIRAGFKELTDIIPTLKNVNNSKSTILFKAVDYIKYLERRNRSLKERASFLEMRVEMEMRPGKRFHHHPAAYGPALGFGHARVSPMQMGPAYSVIPNGINGVGLQMALGHPAPQHVMNGPPPQMQNVYYNPNAADTQSIMTNVSPINSTTNNLYRQNGVVTIPQPHSLNDNFKLTSAMSIPTNLEDQDLQQRPLMVPSGSTLDVDGDSSMVMSGNVRSSGGSVVVKG